MEGTKHVSVDEVMTDFPGGIRAATFTVGGSDAPPDAPRVAYAVWPPGVTVAPHSHGSDYLEIILKGSQRVGKRWHKAGDVRIVRAGTGYGPLVAGPEGVTFMVVMAKGNLTEATWLPSEDKVQKYSVTPPESLMAQVNEPGT